MLLIDAIPSLKPRGMITIYDAMGIFYFKILGFSKTKKKGKDDDDEYVIIESKSDEKRFLVKINAGRVGKDYFARAKNYTALITKPFGGEEEVFLDPETLNRKNSRYNPPPRD